MNINVAKGLEYLRGYTQHILRHTNAAGMHPPYCQLAVLDYWITYRKESSQLIYTIALNLQK